MDLHEIQKIREEGAEIAGLEEAIGNPRRYVLIAYELYASGATSTEMVTDPLVAEAIGRKMHMGRPTDPNGWGIWEVPA